MVHTTEWAYIHIPKTAGLNFIKRSEHRQNVGSWVDFNLKKHENHQTLQWWLNRGIITTQKVFTFVRNPYARIVSLYNHMLTSGNNPELPEFKEFIMKYKFPTFNYLGFGFDLPQYKFIENDQGIDVKYYKMETDLPLVEKYIGYIFTDTNINTKFHAPWHTYYDTETKETVNEKYKEDFKRFNYDEYLPM